MSVNILQNTNWFTMECAKHLYNEMNIAKGFNRSYQKNFDMEFAPGQTIQARYPQRFIGSRSFDWAPEAIDNRTFPISCDRKASIQLEYDSIEKALQLGRSEDYVSEELIKPAILQMSQIIESDAAEFAYLNTPNATGVVGTAFSALTYIDRARALMAEGSTPEDGDWRMILTPEQNAQLKATVSSVFNPQQVVSDAFKKGLIGVGSGFDWYQSNSLYRHTIGNAANAMTIGTSSVNGDTTIALAGTTADILSPGDRFTIGSSPSTYVYAVNSATRRSTGRLKWFVVMDGGTFASSALTVTVNPKILGPGDQYQNVSILPAAGSTVTLWDGTSSPATKAGALGLAFQKDAFCLVGAKLEVPQKAEWAKSSPIPGTPLTVRAIKDWNQEKGKMQFRIDTAYGFGDMYSQYSACMVASN